jgi:predicted amidohydrolase
VRALVVNGAEIVLNPARETHDEHWRMRMQARAARAYENVALVATASPRTLTLDGDTVTLPAASQWADNWGQITSSQGDESFLTITPDIESLRQRRGETRANFPAIVRMNIYAPSLQAKRPRPGKAPETREDWQALAAERIRAQAPPPRDDVELRYDVALCQHVVHQSSKPEQLIPNRQRNLDDVLELAQRVARAPATRLVLLPEFFISGPVSPLGNRLGHLAEQIGVQMDGPEIAQLADFARANKTFMAGGVFEYDPEWPNRFFNTAFILDDAGKLILRYRKIHCGDVMGFLPDTTPGSVYTAFVERYGYESLFPVVDTVLGRLAANICFDMNFPETHRELVRRGAEVILHPTSEPHNRGRRGWDIGRHVRAFENTAYVLSAGHGGEWVGGYPAESTRARGYSKIVNFDGTLQAVVDTAGRSPLSGNIDLAALRRARAQAHANLALWDDPISYAHEYATSPRGIPNDVWTEDPFGNPYAGGREIQRVVAAYIEHGIFVAPSGS